MLAPSASRIARTPVDDVADRLHRLSVDQYERMTEVGVLGPDDRVELLEGWIVDKMTQNPPPNVSVDLTAAELKAVLPEDWLVRQQKAIRLLNSEPEPDIAVVRGPARRYAKRHPRPSDSALFVEVSDTSLSIDRGRKLCIFARAGIPVYWIVNLIDEVVEVHFGPKGGRSPGYQHRHVYGKNDSVPVVIEGRTIGHIAVKDVLP